MERLREEGIKITKPTFIRLMQVENLFKMSRTASGWYVCTPTEMELIIQLIKENYRLQLQSANRAITQEE